MYSIFSLNSINILYKQLSFVWLIRYFSHCLFIIVSFDPRTNYNRPSSDKYQNNMIHALIMTGESLRLQVDASHSPPHFKIITCTVISSIIS